MRAFFWATGSGLTSVIFEPVADLINMTIYIEMWMWTELELWIGVDFVGVLVLRIRGWWLGVVGNLLVKFTRMRWFKANSWRWLTCPLLQCLQKQLGYADC